METKSTPATCAVDLEAWRLLILHAPDRSAVGRGAVLASQRELRLNRGASAPGVLGFADCEVSQQHALIRCSDTSEPGAAWTLHDLGSRNGTFVAGRRIDAQPLRDGDVIRIGQHVLLWQHLDAAACERLIRSPRPPVSTLVGRSDQLLRVHEEIRAVAATRLPVLVLGESGVGKELVAAAIHQAGGGGPFVPVNCAALPEALAESELFGHARGAFTGASGDTAGLFGQAEGGTLFLDEIAEMSPALQAKLLRALALGEVRGVGQRQGRRIEVRVVAATNVDVEAAVSEGRFRGDLYARFIGSQVRVPPLRDRCADVLDLAVHFLGLPELELSTDAAEALLLHPWPWNVRELEQLVSAAAAQARANGRLSMELLPAGLRQPLGDRVRMRAPDPGWDALLGMRRESTPSRAELQSVLAHFRGNVSRVAAFFGRERRQVYRWADQLALDLGVSREPNGHDASQTWSNPQGGDP